MKKQDELLKACKRLINNLPIAHVEEMREIWGNTNVRILLDAIGEVKQAISKAEGR